MVDPAGAAVTAAWMVVNAAGGHRNGSLAVVSLTTMVAACAVSGLEVSVRLTASSRLTKTVFP